MPHSAQDDVAGEAGSPPTAQDAARRLLVLRQIVGSALIAPPREMLQRLMAQWSPEDRAQFERDAEARRDQFRGFLDEAGLSAYLSPWESAYVNATFVEMTDRQQITAMWRLESVQVLMWALRIVRELPPFDRLASHEILKQLPSSDLGSFIRAARLREREMLEQGREIAEFSHWRSRTRELIERGDPFPADAKMRSAGFHSYDDIVRVAARKGANDGILPRCIDDDFPARGKAFRDLTETEWSEVRSVTIERHYTLNWLCGYAPGNRWDETPTDT